MKPTKPKVKHEAFVCWQLFRSSTLPLSAHGEANFALFYPRAHIQDPIRSFDIELRMSRDYCKVPANPRAEPCHYNRRQSFNLILLCPLFSNFFRRFGRLIWSWCVLNENSSSVQRRKENCKWKSTYQYWSGGLCCMLKLRLGDIQSCSGCKKELWLFGEALSVLRNYSFICWYKFCLYIQHLPSWMRSNYKIVMYVLSLKRCF